jgi:hypothetical protein
MKREAVRVEPISTSREVEGADLIDCVAVV